MSVNRRDFLKLTAAGMGGSLLGITENAAAKISADEMADNYSMLNDSTKCIGCRACQAACKRVHGLERAGDNPLYDMPTDLNANSLTLIQLYKESEDKWAFVKKQCMHCNYASCVSVCPVSAFTKRNDGVIAYDPDKCIGCRYCLVACPFNAPTFEYNKAAPKIQKCDFCKDIRLAKGLTPACADVCPKGAITFGKRGELLKEAHRRIGENPDRYYDHVYGEHEIGGTSILHLAPREIPFEKLGYKMYGDTPPGELPEKIQHGIFKYWIPPVSLYAVLGLIALVTHRKQKHSEEDSKDES